MSVCQSVAVPNWSMKSAPAWAGSPMSNREGGVCFVILVQFCTSDGLSEALGNHDGCYPCVGAFGSVCFTHGTTGGQGNPVKSSYSVCKFPYVHII